jgi:hypothetical protein
MSVIAYGSGMLGCILGDKYQEKKMHQFDLKLAIEMLSRTPRMLKEWLSNPPEEWTHYKSDAESWSAFDIVGHFIHGEKTDWIPRAQTILQREGIKEFEPFDQFALYETTKGKTLENLLDEFWQLRDKNLEILSRLELQTRGLRASGKAP